MEGRHHAPLKKNCSRDEKSKVHTSFFTVKYSGGELERGSSGGKGKGGSRNCSRGGNRRSKGQGVRASRMGHKRRKSRRVLAKQHEGFLCNSHKGRARSYKSKQRIARSVKTSTSRRKIEPPPARDRWILENAM